MLRPEDEGYLERFGRWLSPGLNNIDHFYPTTTPFTSLCGKYSGALNGIPDMPACQECEALAVKFVEGRIRAEKDAHKHWLASAKRKTGLQDAVKLMRQLDVTTFAEVMEELRQQVRRTRRRKSLDAKLTGHHSRRGRKSG